MRSRSANGPGLRRYLVGALIGVAALALAGGVWSALGVDAQAQVNAGSDGGQQSAWEYTVATVDTFELMARLNELGREGWDIFEVERQVLQLQNAGGQTQLETTSYQVFARRPRQ